MSSGISNAWDWAGDNAGWFVDPIGSGVNQVFPSIPTLGGTINGGGLPGFGGIPGLSPTGAGAPPLPDLMALANQEYMNNLNLLNAQTVANRPNMITPWGALSWAQGPGGQWTANMQLSPAEQQALGSQQNIQQGRSALAENMLWRSGMELAAQYPTLGGWSPTLPGGGGGGGAFDWNSLLGLLGGGGAQQPAAGGAQQPTSGGTARTGTAKPIIGYSSGQVPYQPAPGSNESGAPGDDIVAALHRAVLSMNETGDPNTYLDAYERKLLALDGGESPYPVALARARYEQYGIDSLDDYERKLIGLGPYSGGTGAASGGNIPLAAPQATPVGGSSSSGAFGIGKLGDSISQQIAAAIQQYQQQNPGAPGLDLNSIFPQTGGGGGGGFDWSSLFGQAAGGGAGGNGGFASPATGGTVRDRAETALYERASSRLDPQWDQRRERLRTELYNQGLRPGMAGYDTQMDNFERSRQDAYQTAMNESIMGGGQEASREFGIEQQIYQAALARRLQAINEMNAVMSGQQAQYPQFPSFQGAGSTQGPDLLGAGTSMYGMQLGSYNAQQANQANQMNGLFSMAGTILPFLL